MNLIEKHLSIQLELKAPKSQKNAFGKYNYRSAEDILEAVKPICKKHGLLLKIAGIVYIQSTAKLIDVKDPSMQIEATAQAIIDFDAKGMQMPQRTGAASSYAKKYALGNLLLIDDTKDADATNDHSAKPQLTKDSDNYQKVVTYLDGGGNISNVMSKYSISPALLKQLKNI